MPTTAAEIFHEGLELAEMPQGSRAIVSIWADGGQATVVLLER